MSRLDVRASKRQKHKQTATRDPDFSILLDSTPAEIDSWVDSNVTGNPALKRVLRLLLKAVSALMQRDMEG